MSLVVRSPLPAGTKVLMSLAEPDAYVLSIGEATGRPTAKRRRPTSLRLPIVAAPQQRAATDLVLQLVHDDPATVNELLPLVYGELRRLAQRYMRHERPDHTLTTTALVHEAYLRLVDQTRVQWQDRNHFLGIAAIAMRRILVEHARRRNVQRRGGDRQRVSLSDLSIAQDDSADTLLALDEAMVRLAALNPRLVRVVECRYFLGLTEEETAAALEITSRTVRRDWIKAKGWLATALADDVK
ncbi:MAG TPA: sigma-70 family RNA polymerase sigma factor [Gemmatimonadaceae bacterium]|nr:sigma-70 family RNA polymerase sigma factor [Gemmatimonadaceae bacterium]